MSKLTINRLANLIQRLDKHSKLKDLVGSKHNIYFPEINHELHNHLFIIFVGCNELLLNDYNTANYSNIELLKKKFNIDVQIVGKHRVKGALLLSKGRFTFT